MTNQSGSPENEAPSLDQRERALIVRVGQERFGIPLEAVIEVFESAMPPASVPGAPDWLGGVINHHGRVIPVLDLGEFLGLEGRSPAQNIVLVQLREEKIAVKVEQIESLERIRVDGLALQGRRRSWHRGKLVEMLDPAGFEEEIRRRLIGVTG